MSPGVCFSVIGTFVALSQVVLDLAPCWTRDSKRMSFMYSCRNNNRSLKLTRCSAQIDFTLIRIVADLAVNFFTTGW